MIKYAKWNKKDSFFVRLLPKNGIFVKIFLLFMVTKYIQKLLSFEEYSFSFEEVLVESHKGETAIRSELSRLVKKKEIISLRKGFYLIIPPRYAAFEKLPIQLYAKKLFKYLQRKYYIGFYSAAKIWGASHQQVQQDYLATSYPRLKNINKKNTSISFYSMSCWPEGNIVTKKADAGYYKVSDPALTITDLVHHHQKLGGLNRVISVIEELSEELTIAQIKELLQWYPFKSTLQRVGFLLEKMEVPTEITEKIYNKLQQQMFYPVLLSPNKNKKPSTIKNRWKIDVNVKLESDL